MKPRVAPTLYPEGPYGRTGMTIGQAPPVKPEVAAVLSRQQREAATHPVSGALERKFGGHAGERGASVMQNALAGVHDLVYGAVRGAAKLGEDYVAGQVTPKNVANAAVSTVRNVYNTYKSNYSSVGAYKNYWHQEPVNAALDILGAGSFARGLASGATAPIRNAIARDATDIIRRDAHIGVAELALPIQQRDLLAATSNWKDAGRALDQAIRQRNDIEFGYGGVTLYKLLNNRASMSTLSNVTKQLEGNVLDKMERVSKTEAVASMNKSPRLVYAIAKRAQHWGDKKSVQTAKPVTRNTPSGLKRY